MLKKTTGCKINYGKTTYDFDDETVVSFAPGQTVEIHRIEDGPAPEAVGLLFHPDFLLRTPLGQKIKQYPFFSYASNEALHLSTEERLILQDYMAKIARELQHPIDKFSKSLIVSNIEVMLNYCMRFYERQFVTREELNHNVIGKFEQLVDEYLDSGRGMTDAADSEVFRRQDMSFAKLFRRPGEAGDGQDGPGVYPAQDDKSRQERVAESGPKHQADCRAAWFPAPAAFHQVFQEPDRQHSEGIPAPAQLSRHTVVIGRRHGPIISSGHHTLVCVYFVAVYDFDTGLAWPAHI